MRSCLPVLVAFVALASVGSASAALDSFRTPSGNIGCMYAKFSGEPAYLRCDILSGLKPKPPRPSSCPDYVEWGYGYSMGKTGKASAVCAGDTAVVPDAKVLGYGRSWSRNGFSCTSLERGLRCRNASGHGFFLSRQRSYKF